MVFLPKQRCLEICRYVRLNSTFPIVAALHSLVVCKITLPCKCFIPSLFLTDLLGPLYCYQTYHQGLSCQNNNALQVHKTSVTDSSFYSH